MKDFEQPAAPLVAAGGTPLSRRQFLVRTLGGAGLVLLPACSNPMASGLDGAALLPGDGSTSGGGDLAWTATPSDLAVGSDGGALDLATAQCLETEDEILGPFYRANAPFRTVLADPGEGEPLVISGVVRVAGDLCSALPGALIDVWQANAAAEYDLDTADFKWRGRLNAGADGRYSFSTVLPGRYLNGANYRPRHIHFKISQPGYRALTTQLYFEGDPFIPVDPFTKPSLVIPLVQAAGVWSGTFDIALPKVT